MAGSSSRKAPRALMSDRVVDGEGTALEHFGPDEEVDYKCDGWLQANRLMIDHKDQAIFPLPLANSPWPKHNPRPSLAAQRKERASHHPHFRKEKRGSGHVPCPNSKASCWLGPELSESVAAVQAHFQPRPDDIILATYPKCGTTWLKALAFAIANRSLHAATGENHPLLTHLPHAFVANLEFPLRFLHPITELEVLSSPRLLCTHLPFPLLPSGVSDLGCRIVYLCREPKDVRVHVALYEQGVP
ncbi:Cytosolic sulfotransferase 8 [Dichanthelium oligosanthes]|uniref:Sulfotransferase n=1 Tax=Dichanthelium oligosanthes TaxID=888268 RepID=A0A1E5VD01_9POAL|nr:Cytosolic sulfotransferase 8 [Dichanthelium oligosanthes]